MKVAEHASEVVRETAGYRKSRHIIGLVPTMGSLHAGHLSLLDRSLAESDITIVSIFVNPTQFDDPNDLLRYPRNIPDDLEILKTRLRHNDLVFIPEEKEIYPEPDTRVFDLGGLDQILEGKFRKGHFNGVAQVVTRLFEITAPDLAFFGEKDFQQVTIIRHLVKKLGLPVRIVPCPILREHDGLAMSSRNQLLSVTERNEASLIPKTLFMAVEKSKVSGVGQVIAFVTETINKSPQLRLEYFEIVSISDLQPIKEWQTDQEAVGCIAVRAGNIRLIDNVRFPRF